MNGSFPPPQTVSLPKICCPSLPNKEAKAQKYLSSTTYRLEITLDIRIDKPESSSGWENRISTSKSVTEIQFIVPSQQSGLTKHKKLGLA